MEGSIKEVSLRRFRHGTTRWTRPILARLLWIQQHQPAPWICRCGTAPVAGCHRGLVAEAKRDSGRFRHRNRAGFSDTERLPVSRQPDGGSTPLASGL